MSQSPAAASGSAKRTPRASAMAARAGLMSISSTRAPGTRAASACGQAADDAGPDDRDAAADRGQGVPQDIDRRLHVGGQRRAVGRDRVGNRHHRIGGHDEQVLVRVQAEDAPAQQMIRAGFHLAHHAVAVFDGSGEIAFLERAAHDVEQFGRHPALEHEAFGPPADGADERPHQDFTGGRGRQDRLAKLATAGGNRPEGCCREFGVRFSHEERNRTGCPTPARNGASGAAGRRRWCRSQAG